MDHEPFEDFAARIVPLGDGPLKLQPWQRDLVHLALGVDVGFVPNWHNRGEPPANGQKTPYRRDAATRTEPR